MMADGMEIGAAAGTLLAAYRPRPGVPDEMMDEAGRIRPVWRDFIARLAAMTPREIAARTARGDQYLRDAGVFHRQYGAAGEAERDWPLSHVPVLIDEAEWEGLSAGLRQRADLLEDLAADFYGPNRMVAEGRLPPALVAGNPGWLRPLVGLRPAGGHFLHFVAFDLGRGPGGSWWVLADRTEAPSGAGFALENRIATSRVFADIYAQMNVHRLARFFRLFRDRLTGLRGQPGDRIGILTPGTMNDTYLEHAFIARYLGFMLLTGEDLAMRDGELTIRTTGGLVPVSVLWRRVDSEWTDPLELRGDSRLGTPGLLGAIRSGRLSMVNALGAGLVETRALLAFMPRLAQALRGEALALPNIATWWCGQRAEREHVIAAAERMTIAPALSTRLPFDLEETSAVAGHFRGAPPAGSIAEWVERERGGLVGQEAVTLSTTPALVRGRLVPRPFTLRVYLVRTATGWELMPGGFARVGRTGAPEAVALQKGGSVADVWLVSPDRVPHDTMMEPPAVLRRQPTVLPARAADNLFWLGRYVERAETTARLLRAWHVRVAETGLRRSELLDQIGRALARRNAEPGAGGIPGGLIDTLRFAVSSASHVRDRFSVDGWMALTDLSRTATAMSARLQPGDDGLRAMSVLIRKITGFSGLVHENMYHAAGWRFLAIGRALERALSTATLLADLADPAAPAGALDALVEVGDSVMTHRRSFALETSRITVVDLLALDRMNPRALLFQLDQLRDRLAEMVPPDQNAPLSELDRAVIRLHSFVATATPEELDTAALRRVQGEIADLSGRITQSYLR